MVLSCEWDEQKNAVNIRKHGVSFFDAQRAFLDPHRVIAEDTKLVHPLKCGIIVRYGG